MKRSANNSVDQRAKWRRCEDKTTADIVYTPRDVVYDCMTAMRAYVVPGDVWSDPFAGTGAFIDQFPSETRNVAGDIMTGQNFFDTQSKSCDWIVSNPPYSLFDSVLDHSCKVCRKGFAYVVSLKKLVVSRLQRTADLGFNVIKLSLFQVSGEAREMQEANEGCVLVAYRCYDCPGMSAEKITVLYCFTASNVPSDVWKIVTDKYAFEPDLTTEPQFSTSLNRAIKFVRFLCTDDRSDALNEEWFPKNSDGFVVETSGGLLGTPLCYPVIAFYSFDSEEIGAEKHFK